MFCTSLGVSRSQLNERLNGARKLRSAYRMAEDAELLLPLRTLVDARPTSGCRHITALLNRERLKTGLLRLNHKRIYRLRPDAQTVLSQSPANEVTP
jgi:putative transposase